MVKTLSHVITRRDRCYLFGRRGRKLNQLQAAEAWWAFPEKLEEMGDMDIPKFKHLLIAFRDATVLAKKRR